MTNERVIVCGTADGADLPLLKKPTVRVRIWGPAANVSVQIERMRTALMRDLPDVFLDLIDVATYVYIADQAVSRGSRTDEKFGANWRRQFHFAIAVRQPKLWSRPAVRNALVEALRFLSEDEYCFSFEKTADGPSLEPYLRYPVAEESVPIQEVMLFSGGIDSLTGAVLRAVKDRKRVALVQHRSIDKTLPLHRKLIRRLEAMATDSTPLHIPVWIKKTDQSLSKESTQRTRSFLYTALGTVVAKLLGQDRLSVYENGVVSLNLPPCSQVIGARASRTTHPGALAALQRLFSELGNTPFEIVTPFQWLTKTDVLEQLAAASASDLLPLTRSCANTRMASNSVPHCGSCSQCVDRRFSVLAAKLGGQEPANHYLTDLLTGPIKDGRQRTMIAIFTEMARQVAGMTAEKFFARFGEATRVLHCFGEKEDIVGRKVFDLYQRQASQVNRAVEVGIAENSKRLLDRSLPESCLLRMVVETGLYEVEEIAPPASPPPQPDNYFRKTGAGWRVRFDGGSEVELVDLIGFYYLHRLLQIPGRSIKVRALCDSVSGNKEALAVPQAFDEENEEALQIYKESYEHLQNELDAARRTNDKNKIRSIGAEMRQLSDEIKRQKKGFGKKRKGSPELEKYRKSVFIAFSRALKEIKLHDPKLHEHLQFPRLVLGNEPCYAPPPGIHWET